MDTRVFWSVLCALLVFSGLAAFGSAMWVVAQREAARQAAAQLASQALQVTRAEQAQLQQKAAYQQWLHDRMRLQPSQRCVGGAVVEVHGAAYTQVGYPGHPAQCSGDYADQPMR